MSKCPVPFVYTVESNCSPLVTNSIDLTKGLTKVVDSVKESTAVLREESKNIRNQLKLIENSVEESTETVQKQVENTKAGFNQISDAVKVSTRNLVEEGKNTQKIISVESSTTRDKLEAHISSVLDQLVKVMEGNVKAIDSLKDVVSNLGTGSPLTDVGRLTFRNAVKFLNKIEISGPVGSLLSAIENLAKECGHFYKSEAGLCNVLLFVQAWPFTTQDQPPRRGLVPVRAWALEREDNPGYRYIMGYTTPVVNPCSLAAFGHCLVPEWVLARRNIGVRISLSLSQLF